jgi:Ser/Thr protein kinase RdoA (MazF antagonist)
MYQDLQQYFNAAQIANLCEEAYIVSEVIEALKELVEARVHHADLHLGNVLLQRYDGQINVLIHDFGSSVKNCNNVASYEFDLTTFLDHILERGRFASEIKQIEKLCEGYGDSFEGFNHVLEQASSIFKALHNNTT